MNTQGKAGGSAPAGPGGSAPAAAGGLASPGPAVLMYVLQITDGPDPLLVQYYKKRGAGGGWLEGGSARFTVVQERRY